MGLVGLQTYGLDEAAVAVIPSRQRRHDRHRSLGCDCWRWRRAMDVALEIGEYLGGPTERLLGVDDPSGAAHMSGEGMEARGVQRGVRGRRRTSRAPASKAFCKRSMKRRRKSFASGLTAGEEVRPPGDPARPIGRETAAWHRRNARVDDASASAPTWCRTATTPICAPSLRGLAASVIIAYRPTPQTGSRRRRPCSGTRWAAIGAGNVNTTWK